MLATRIIPTLLARGTTLVKGQKFDSWRSVGHVLQAARIYQERGVDELIILDIGATPEGRGPNCNLIEEITRECFMPLTVGGGVRSVDDVRDLLNAGADKVAVCTKFVGSPATVARMANKFGAQCIVAALDVKSGCVAARCGTDIVGHDPATQAARYRRDGAGEILLTSIDREGTMQGYDLDLIKAVSDAVSIPVIAHGGCRDYEDMYNAIQAGASAVAAGALWQFTDATPKEAARYLHERGIEVRV